MAAVPKSRQNYPNATHQAIFWQNVHLQEPQLLRFSYQMTDHTFPSP